MIPVEVALPKIRALFFDLYGTLAHFEPSREKIQVSAAGEHGHSITEKGVTKGYKAADEFMANQNAVRAVRSMSRNEQSIFFTQYEQHVLEGAGLYVDSSTEQQIWQSVRTQHYGLALFPDVLPSLSTLKKKGLTLGIISYMASMSDVIGMELGLTGKVSVIVTSLEIGFEKPHPKIFLEALERAEVKPEETIYVGDQPKSDVDGARAIGINPILMDRYGVYPNYDLAPRINSMEGLLKIVGQLRRVT